MKKYWIVFHPEAEQDIRASYKWGCRVWGKAKSKQWAQELRLTIINRLATFPTSCPVAPESEALAETVRQLCIGRYRVLFTINGKTVRIQHIRGPYVEDSMLFVPENEPE